MKTYPMEKRWYDVRIPGAGTIMIQAATAAQAIDEAADRMGATAEQIERATWTIPPTVFEEAGRNRKGEMRA